MRRWGLVIVGAVAVLALALVQVANDAAYGGHAVRWSLPAALHRVDARLLRPFAGSAFARAQAAVAADDPDADRLVAALPQDDAAYDLRGILAARRGADAAAVEAFVRSGDVDRARAFIDVVAETDPARAVREQRRLLGVLHGDREASEVTGEAWWRLGVLEATVGYVHPAERRAAWARAGAAYERALTYAPNEETYLLAAGYQALANGDAVRAKRWYTRAADVVPGSPDAHAGLAWVAAARGQCALARAEAARIAGARERDPADDPNVGAPLRRCLGRPAHA